MRAVQADLAALARRLPGEERVAMAVHEKPDTDALGAAAGLLDLCAQLDVPAALHVDPAETLPLAEELLPAGSVAHDPPPAGTTLYALDCGSADRIALPSTEWAGYVVNIDHHHDNTRFGDLVVLRGAASSTSEVVCDLARVLGLRPSPAAAAALYAGISFDTGHFRHQSTAAATFSTAAWLVELGADPTAVYGLLYEHRSVGSLRLWGRALAGMTVVAGGRALLAQVLRDDYAAAAAGDDETEGIVEALRAAEGVEVAAVVKEQTQGPRVRVSLRSSGFDVSELAGIRGGGGHRQAAGFSSDDDPGEVTAWLRTELERRLKTASS
jgi:phosphoesterase RecJ-like protein